MDIRTFYKYNRLARRGLVSPLSCETCNNEFVLRATEDADPLLQCFYCDRIIQPGLGLYDRIKAILSEFEV
jgi:hypothetical protein